MGFFKFSKKHIHLEMIISRMESNKENNYKDAAQQALQQYEAKLQELKAAGKLTDKQITHYDAQLAAYKERMLKFTHKDQKPFWT